MDNLREGEKSDLVSKPTRLARTVCFVQIYLILNPAFYLFLSACFSMVSFFKFVGIFN